MMCDPARKRRKRKVGDSFSETSTGGVTWRPAAGPACSPPLETLKQLKPFREKPRWQTLQT